jgi:hypothetical protein
MALFKDGSGKAKGEELLERIENPGLDAPTSVPGGRTRDPAANGLANRVPGSGGF